MCTIEGKTGTISATGTTPHSVPTGCSHLCRAISQALYLVTGTIVGSRHCRGICTIGEWIGVKAPNRYGM